MVVSTQIVKCLQINILGVLFLKKKKKLKQAFLKCLQIFNPKKQKTNKQGGVH